ncbi:MAG: SRPBCC family protein [Terracidiphilus sp.]|jgi:ribosome-associated toxin RatA of RatAB toxin-antitoxin module
MREVLLQARVAQDASSVYDALADLGSYPRHMSSVRKVDLLSNSGFTCTSAWEVEFRNGLLQWTEKDDFDRDSLRITFTQIQGDLEAFSGYWQVFPVGTESRVTFAALFDLGIPSLAEFLEPVAQSAIEENVSKVLRGLFGAHCQIENSSHLESPLSDMAAI